MTPAQLSWMALSAILASVALPGAAAASDRHCEVDGTEGQRNRVWQDGAWNDLVTGIPVSAEATIVTGPEGRVNVTCDDGIVVTIGPDSEVKLEQIAGRSGPGHSAIIQLIDGIIGIVAPSRTWKLFEVRTPLAIASVRSTEWLVEHRADPGTAVFVREGLVDVASGREVYRLAKGDGVTIAGTATAAVVKQWSAERIAASGSALGFGWK